MGRGELANNITLSGGNTKFPNFDKRLSAELSSLLPEGQEARVKALPNRELLSWAGGARLSNLSSFQRFWVTKADYQEKRPNEGLHFDPCKCCWCRTQWEFRGCCCLSR